MNKLYLVSAALITSALVYSCKKDKPIQFSATPYQLNIPSGLPAVVSPANNPLSVEGVELGRKLFYDPILSANNSQACASCHNQANAFTDTNRYSKGITGALGTRNAMPLFNLGHRKHFFWDGRDTSLEQQALHPIENPIEMNAKLSDVITKLQNTAPYPELFKKAFGSSTITSEMLGKAIAQFERTLLSGNSKYDKFARGEVQLTATETQGMNLFNDMKKGDCLHCHAVGSNFSDSDFKNNGLDESPKDLGRYLVTMKPSDSGKMITPSLRNITLTAPYMHDGRFKTLEEVLDHYNTGFHKVSNLDPNIFEQEYGRMSKQEMNAIIAFLKTLTDEEFISNPKFAKPQ